MPLDLTTIKPGTMFQTRSVGTAEYLGPGKHTIRHDYPCNNFRWRLNNPGKTTFSTDSAGRYFLNGLSALDILHQVPSSSVDLSNCRFGDLVKLRNGRYAIVLIPRSCDNRWVHIGMDNGNTTVILRNSGHAYAYRESPRDVVEIIGPHPLAPRKYEASVTISKTITGTRNNAQEFIDRQKAEWEPREGTMVCNIKEL